MNDGNDDKDHEEKQKEKSCSNTISEDEDEGLNVEKSIGSDEDDDSDAPPKLVKMKEEEEEGKGVIDLKSMSDESRNNLSQNISSTRVFTTSEFEKMRKLVEREQKLRRDPRAAAKRRRALARKGTAFEQLSDGDDTDESLSDDDDEGEQTVSTHGVVNPEDIMAMAKKKRMNKAQRIQKIMAGREKFQSKTRAGGTTNTEKTRKKSFVMTKFSYNARSKIGQKETSKGSRKKKIMKGSHDAKKRRRKT